MVWNANAGWIKSRVASASSLSRLAWLMKTLLIQFPQNSSNSSQQHGIYSNVGIQREIPVSTQCVPDLNSFAK